VVGVNQLGTRNTSIHNPPGRRIRGGEVGGAWRVVVRSQAMARGRPKAGCPACMQAAKDASTPARARARTVFRRSRAPPSCKDRIYGAHARQPTRMGAVRAVFCKSVLLQPPVAETVLSHGAKKTPRAGKRRTCARVCLIKIGRRRVIVRAVKMPRYASAIPRRRSPETLQTSRASPPAAIVQCQPCASRVQTVVATCSLSQRKRCARRSA